jgi:hypothetical protein
MSRTGTLDIGPTSLEISDSLLNKSEVGSIPLKVHLKLVKKKRISVLVRFRKLYLFRNVTSPWIGQLSKAYLAFLYLLPFKLSIMVGLIS